MSASPALAPPANRLLAALPPQEQAHFLPLAEEVALRFGEVLHEPGDMLRHVYFPTAGLVSLILVDGRQIIEAGMVGSEGMVGLPVFLGADTSLQRAVVQGTGTALRVRADDLQAHCDRDGALPRLLSRYTHTLMLQVFQSVACNRFHSVVARLARWLLMTHDRTGTDEFLLTHEFLAAMLGVRRAGVTDAASLLQERSLIRYGRGWLTILDRAGLEATSCSCYRIIRRESDRLFP